MGETVTPWKFSVEGESGSESDERIGAGPRWAGDRGGGKSDAAAVLGRVQTEDRPGGRRLQDAGRGRGVAAAGGAVLLAPDDVARGAGARRGGAHSHPRAVAYAALRGPRAGRGLRYPPRRGHVSLLRADDVSPPGRARRGAGAARSAPASPLCGPGAAGPPP